MGNGNFFDSLKQKARALYNNFFYEGEEAPAPRIEESYPPQQEQQPYYQQAPQGYQQQAYQAPVYQQQAQQPQSYQAPVYQQPAPQQPFQAPARNRRTQQHAAQQESNVVDFNVYQQQAGAYQQSVAQQPAPQQPPFQPEQPQPAVGGALLNARVINARGMGDCRSAITLLRGGDAVLIVLENVTDPAEMRRLVDTLSGACYSLTATITKVSRYGVYLLAPQTMAVYADQATNQMNGAPTRTAQRPMYQPGMNQAGQRTMYQPQSAYQQPQQNAAGFTQRSAVAEEAAQPFYARTAPQEAQVPAFSAQPAGYGYAPDEAVNQ